MTADEAASLIIHCELSISTESASTMEQELIMLIKLALLRLKSIERSDPLHS